MLLFGLAAYVHRFLPDSLNLSIILLIVDDEIPKFKIAIVRYILYVLKLLDYLLTQLFTKW